MPMRIRRILTAIVRGCSFSGVARPSRWVCRSPIAPRWPGTTRQPAGAACGSLPGEAQLAQAPGVHAGELLHHLTGLAKLLDDRVHLLGGGARATGDTGAPRAVEDLGVVALGRRHRADDRLDPGDVAVVDLDVLELPAHPGQHPQNLVQRPP